MSHSTKHLHFGLEYDMCISCLSNPKYAAKVIRGQVANIPNFEFWRLSVVMSRDLRQLGNTHLSAHLELNDFYLVSDDGRLVALVEGIIEHLDGIGVKLVGKAWPFECERHFWRRLQCSVS